MTSKTATTALRTFLAFSTLLHLLHLEWTLVAVLVSSVVASVVIARSPDGATRSIATVICGALAATAVLIQAPWTSGDAIVTLLGSAAWLKLAEIRGPRDRLLVWAVAYWLLGMSWLWLPPGAALLTMAAGITLAFGTLAVFGTGKVRGRRLAPMLAIAIPLTAVLFTFTPRITGNLGVLGFALGIPLIIETDAEKQRDPMQDSLSMGDLADRASSTDLRVLVASFLRASGKFYDGAPPLGDLYWRGPVLWSYLDGKWAGRPGWERRGNRMKGKLTHETFEQVLRETGLISLYDVKLFPHNGYWLYALDFPAAVPASTFITRDYQLQNLNPVREVLSYPMMSFLDYRAGKELDAETRLLALQLPDGQEPQTIALGRDLRGQHDGPVAIAKAGLALFESGYRYDKRFGGVEGTNPVDRFLFEAKAGYAGHYATAYTLMMRAAGIPARLVMGYRGGTHLGLTNRVYVLENQAHAWSEIWLEDYGWVRMDPATRFSPRRSRGSDNGWGLADQLDTETAQMPANESAAVRFETGDVETMRKPVGKTDSEKSGPSWWQRWIVDFDSRRQIQLLDGASLASDWRNLIALAAGLIAIGITLVLVIRMLLRWLRERRQPPLERMERLFCRRLARISGHRRRAEGLNTYIARAESMGGSGELTGLGQRLRAALYGDRPLHPDWVEQLENATRRKRKFRAILNLLSREKCP